MQLKINFIFPPGTELPINYQHIQQGIIFKALKDNPEYSDYMHDVGFGSEKRKYKAFVFSPFLGKYTIQNKRISFSGDIEFEIRSVDNRFIQALYCGIEKEGIKLGETRIIPEEIYVLDEEIETETVIVRMVSPLTLYTTEENGFTHYYAPNEPGFKNLLNDNFRRKYKAYYDIEPEGEIDFKIIGLNESNKRIVRYKQTYVGGWTGIYKLSGKRKYLNFLYQTGLGSRNSQGFGMFCIHK